MSNLEPQTKPEGGASVSTAMLGTTLDLLNKHLPRNPPWGPGQYVSVEALSILVLAERDGFRAQCARDSADATNTERQRCADVCERRADSLREGAAVARQCAKDILNGA
jgi:hypothetical protein